METFDKQSAVERLVNENDIQLLRKLVIRVDSFELPVGTLNGLWNDNRVYVGDIVQETEREFLRTPNIGLKALSVVKDVILKPLNLTFGIRVIGWPERTKEGSYRPYSEAHGEIVDALSGRLEAVGENLRSRTVAEGASQAKLQSPLLDPTTARGRLFMRRAGLLRRAL